MQEIKFRAILNKEVRAGYNYWVDPVYFTLEDLIRGKVSFTNPEHWTFSLYTGIKDKYGREIYGGDIIKANLPYGKLFVVNWVNTRGAFMLAGATEQDFAAYDREGYKLNAGKKEIVGNIYENYNLIK